MLTTVPPHISAVIPMMNEEETASYLIAELTSALKLLASYEIIVVDDGSNDATAFIVQTEQMKNPALRLIRHVNRCGQSAALRSGIVAAKAPFIVTLDGDGQNDPADISKLWTTFMKERNVTPKQPVLVAGWRLKRYDGWQKRLASRIANRVRLVLLRDTTPDTGCGLKMFERTVFLDFPYFDHMHRYLGALMHRQGGRVISVPVAHRPRKYGASKYGIFDRLLVGLVDIFGVMWLRRRGSIPVLHDTTKQR